MTRQEKSEIIDFLAAEFKNSLAVVVCDYKGLTHKELETLRKDARANNTKVQVVKNTLVTKAVKSADLGDIDLSGTNIYLWSDDQISACKVADKFATTTNYKLQNKAPFRRFIEPVTAILDLKTGEEALLASFAEKGRYNIRLAQKR